MDSTELQRAEHRARIAYEMSRLRRAVIAFAPILLLVAVAVAAGHRSGPTLAIGAALFIFGIVLLWYGRDVKRAVLPGLAAGAVPLFLAICAKRAGHVCMGDACMAMCVPACIAGGLIAGAIVGVVGIRGKRGVGFWLAASGVTLLTGAMGCVCVGVSGLVGLTLGFAVSAAPGLISAVVRSRSRERHEASP